MPSTCLTVTSPISAENGPSSQSWYHTCNTNNPHPAATASCHIPCTQDEIRAEKEAQQRINNKAEAELRVKQAELDCQLCKMMQVQLKLQVLALQAGVELDLLAELELLAKMEIMEGPNIGSVGKEELADAMASNIEMEVPDKAQDSSWATLPGIDLHNDQPCSCSSSPVSLPEKPKVCLLLWIPRCSSNCHLTPAINYHKGFEGSGL